MRLLHLLAVVPACGSKVAVDAAEEPKHSEASAAADVSTGAPTIVYVVRHAEATSPTGDPSLSDDGIARARRLATVMADKHLGAIDTTQFQRTTETAKAVAAVVGLAVDVVSVDPANVAAYPPQLATHLEQKHSGMATLVVGHSTTVPGTVAALSGTTVPPMALTEYDRLYTITIAADGSAEVTSGTY